MAENSAAPQERTDAAQRVALVVVVVILAAAGLVYWKYVRRQREYYTGRDLRVLRTMTAELDDLIAANSGYLKNAVRYGDPSVLRVNENCGQAATPVDAALKARLVAAPENELFERTLVRSDDGSILHLRYVADAPPKLPALRAGAGSPEGWRPATPPPPPTVRSGCADLPLAGLVQPVFDIEMAQVFDVVLLAGSDGRVLYRTQPPQSRSTLLFASTPDGKRDLSGSPLTIEHLGALAEPTGWFGAPKALDVKTLLPATRTLDAVIGDKSYVAFSQPYTLAGQEKWIVCGLVSSSRFHFDTFAVPAPVVMLATALAILGVCAWPFLRIALMSAMEPLTISDAVLLAICTIIAAAIFTLALLDIFAYRHLTYVARQQLRDFGDKVATDYRRDVARAATALDSIRAKTAAAPDWDGQSIKARLAGPDPSVAPGEADAVKRYPYVASFAWIDAGGVEQFKYAREPKNPRVNVAAREYFAAAKNNERDLSMAGEGEAGAPRRIPFAMQWVRSAATGKVTAAVAERTNVEALPVIVLATDLVDVSAAVPPPGMRFAVVDEQGNVLYHSESHRIGYENLFTESDPSRGLRAAVLGRRAGFVDTSYWGESTEMYVRPLESSTLTLVVFRAKRLVRVLNEEAVLLTLLPLLLTSIPYLLIYLVVPVVAPRYRAPSLWPDPQRRGDYIRLARLYVILGATYALSIYAFASSSFPPIVFLWPAQAIVSTYVLLHRDDRRPRVGVALALWIALTITLGVAMWHAQLDSAALLTALAGRATRLPNILALALLLVAAALSLLSFMPAREGGAARVAYRMSYGSAYRLCGALLLAVAAALPVVGFFKIATHIEMELFVKYAQLRMATMLESRINALASSALDIPGAATARDVLQYKTDEVFDTAWCLTPAPLQSDRQCSTCDQANRSTIPPFFPDVLPELSEDFVATRQLHEAESADKLWKWCSSGDGPLKLDRLIRLRPDNAGKLYAKPEPPQQHLVLSSNVPAMREIHGDTVAHVAWLLALPLLALGVFWTAVDFIARRLLIIDVGEPLWLAHVPLSPSLGDHIFVVRRAKEAADLTGSDAGEPFYDVSFAAMDREESWSATLASLDRSAAGRNVRITDFEYGIDDGQKNWKKLQWLERLLALPDRTVVIVSAVSAGYACSAPTTPPPAPPRITYATLAVPPVVDPQTTPRARWEKILAAFVWVTEEQLELRRAAVAESAEGVAAPAAQTAAASPRGFADRLRNVGPTMWRWLHAVWQWLKRRLTFEPDTTDWLAAETAHNPYLARLAEELEPLRGDVPPGEERQRLMDEIGERARTYYAGLWASCSLDERVLLYQLARHGLLNGKDRRLVRRLMARGFIRRAPQLELFSETFRRYVLGAAREDDLKRVAATLRPSRWKELRVALAVLVLAFVLMLFATQKDLLSTAQGLVTSLAASLPLVIKLLGLLGERRSDAAAHG